MGKTHCGKALECFIMTIKIVLNLNVFNDVDLMFYHNDINAYQFGFSTQQFIDNIASEANRINQLVEKAMAKEDRDRYQSAAEFAHDIERVMTQVYPGTRIASEFDNYMTV